MVTSSALGRATQVIGVCLYEGFRFGIAGRLGSLRRRRGARLASRLEELGGAFPKIGQLLATRPDLLSDDIRQDLSRLQDGMVPLSFATIAGIVANQYARSPFCDLQPDPIATATIAQVHRARRIDDGRPVALKIVRPGVREALETDCAIARRVARQMARFPALKSIPIEEGLADIAGILTAQADFGGEARRLDRLRTLFADSPDILIPAAHLDLCTPQILCMDYVGGMRKLTDPQLSDEDAKQALHAGLRALYTMIFTAGFVHCDLHPGNVLMANDGRLVILDAGFMVELDEATRRAFAAFFLAIALRDGKTATRVVLATATHIPDRLVVAEFQDDMTGLLNRFGGVNAGRFSVVGFVKALFDIQLKHGMRGTSKFTTAILALAVYEGLIRQRFPSMDFQGAAIPFVLASLGRR